MFAKLANEAEAEESESEASGPIIDADYTAVDDGETDPSESDEDGRSAGAGGGSSSGPSDGPASGGAEPFAGF